MMAIKCNVTINGQEPVITDLLLRARINNKNNGTVAGFQVIKCRYIEGSKNGSVTSPFRHGPVTGPYDPSTFTCVP